MLSATVPGTPWRYLCNSAMYLGPGNTTTRLPAAARGCCPPWTSGGTESPPFTDRLRGGERIGSTTRGSSSDINRRIRLACHYSTTVHHHNHRHETTLRTILANDERCSLCDRPALDRPRMQPEIRYVEFQVHRYVKKDRLCESAL